MSLTKTTIKYSSGKSEYEYYKNPQDQVHGPYTSFWSNGQKDFEGSWIFDRWVGVWKVYAKSDGRRKLIDTNKNGLNGVEIWFN